MSWNNRIMRHVEDNGEVWYGLHEVYYRRGKVWLWDETPTSITGDTPSDMFGLLANCVRDAWKSRHEILDFKTGKGIGR